MLQSIDTCLYFHKNEIVETGLLKKQKTTFFSPEKEILSLQPSIKTHPEIGVQAVASQKYCIFASTQQHCVRI